MPIPFTCPHCGLETNVADQFAGQSGPCSKCGNTVTVPVPSGAAPFAAPITPAKSSMSVGVIVLIVVLVIGALLLCLGIPIAAYLTAVPVAREAARRAQCTNNLKQIGIAMLNYHDAYLCFPPAVITDEEGTPRYSWRVAILPFIEQQALYDLWNHDEPWDSPNNMRIGQTSIPAYRCPSDDDPTETNYVMITGEEAIGNLPNEVTKIADVRDGTARTIMIVEVVDSGIGWSEPRDLSLDDLEMRINAPGGIASKHPGGVNVALCNGSVRFVPESISAEDLRAWITKGGMETPPDF
jgi:hypothetical protein